MIYIWTDEGRREEEKKMQLGIYHILHKQRYSAKVQLKMHLPIPHFQENAYFVPHNSGPFSVLSSNISATYYQGTLI